MEKERLSNSSVKFEEPSALHQRSLVVVVTSYHHLLNRSRTGLKYEEERFQMKERQ